MGSTKEDAQGGGAVYTELTTRAGIQSMKLVDSYQYSSLPPQECDQEDQGFLTESSISSALDKVLPLRDKLEVLNILGVLNCSDARVSLPVFKQKVLEFLERASEKEEDSEKCDMENMNNIDYQSIISSFSQVQSQVSDHIPTYSSLDESINLKMSPFKPNLNSSFLYCESAGCSPPDTPSPPLPRLSFTEDTFEGDGEEKRVAGTEVVETQNRKTSILHSRSLRFRKHLRSHSRTRAGQYNRTMSSPAIDSHRVDGDEEPDRINNNYTKSKLDFTEMSRLCSSVSESNNNHVGDCPSLDHSLLNFKLQTEDDEKTRLQEENNALLRQLNQSEIIVKRFEDELSLEGRTVQSLEEKLSFIETNNKELLHELENSRHNIKNLEDHLLYMEEKFNIENKELHSEKCLLMQEKEKKIMCRREELEMREDEILSEKHILQLEIATLRRENKLLSEKNESLERSSQEDLSKLTLENKALKDKLNNLTLRKVDLQFVKELVTCEEKKPLIQNQPLKRNIIKSLAKRICFATALRSVYEIIIYLIKDYE